jgi:tetratricopeptide (TPR) repeat protein
MEFLKKYGFYLGLFFATLNIYAQDTKQLQSAFSQSYIFESNKNYTAAIDVIIKVHSDKQYVTAMRLGWLYYLSQKNLESANYYQKAIDLMPAAIEPKLGKVSPLAALNNWDQIIQLYTDILKIEPNNATINYRIGLIFYNRQNYAAAKKYFDIYLNLYPFDFDAVSISAWTSFRLGKVDIARALFNKALLIYPTNADCLEGLRLCK